jgi:putative spermidine/putrescine transport system substrate-binding protein
MRILGVALVASVLCAACIGSSPSSTSTGSKYTTATSAASSGGMNALIAAAKAEGQLNLIALPPDWANFGAIVTGFHSTYGISVTVDNPNGNSNDEINTVKSLGKSKRAPDALDLEMVDALANSDLFAPYEVQTWSDIPDAQKESSGLWAQDYGGYMSIGYDSSKVPAITSLQDLVAPGFKGKVALKGDPNLSITALESVMMASLANGGSPDDISPGVAYFHQLVKAGDIVSLHATSATVKSGVTPVVFDWDYLSVAHVQDIPTWTIVIPSNAVVGDYFAQAINKNAPHPAAARLWEEYLYSADGQNLLLKGLVRPVRMAAMANAGTLDTTAAAALPQVVGPPVFLSPDQLTAAQKYLAGHWAAAMT